MGYSPAGKVKSSISIPVLDVDINVGNFNKKLDNLKMTIPGIRN